MVSCADIAGDTTGSGGGSGGGGAVSIAITAGDGFLRKTSRFEEIFGGGKNASDTGTSCGMIDSS